MPEERPSRDRVLDKETEHTIKNHLAVIAGFCELLLTETPEDDPHFGDLVEMNRSARALIEIFTAAPGK